MRLGALAAVVILAAGCNALLDLKLPPDVDHDSDNRPDREDNCPDISNPDQSDFDHDGAGDACDECVDGGGEDVDADGIPDGCDGCVGNGEDVDHDGVPDNCDGCLESGVDEDNDGLDDACDACVGNGLDADADGIDDACDDCQNSYVDVDADGIDDGCDACIESRVDADHDGVDDACDPCTLGPQHDEDGDGLFDACDNCKALANPMQNDSGDAKAPDGVGKACDKDSGQDYELFDAFDQDNPAWFVQGANWDRAGDSMRFLGATMSSSTSYRSLGRVISWFTVATTVNPMPPLNLVSAPNGSFGVYVTQNELQPSATRMTCTVETSALASGSLLWGRVYLNNATTAVTESSAVVSLGNRVDVIMQVDDTMNSLTCSAGSISITLPLATVGSPWTPGLVAKNTAVEFKFFDVITQ